MSATALSRGRILDPLEILRESLEYVHRDLAPFLDIDERVSQFDNDVKQFIISVKKAQQLRIAGSQGLT
jgi:hypothetical protein